MSSRQKFAVFCFSLLAVLLVFFFSSCSMIEDALGSEDPSLSVSVLAPSEGSDDYGYRVADVSSCRIDVYRDSGKFYSGYTAPSSSISLDVSKGNYSIYAYGYDSVGTYIAIGSGHASVGNGEEDVLIQLVWDIAEKTDGDYAIVRFNTNGGTSIASQKIEKGGTATKPDDPIRAGYDFDGWYATSSLSEQFDFTTAITYNKTIFAKWTGDGVTNEIFVSSSGNDDTGTGAEDAPFLTLQRAITKITELGDATDYTIYVSGHVSGNTEIPSSLPATSVTIIGKTSSASDILDGNAASNVVKVVTPIPIIFKNITIMNGLATTEGGGGISMKSNTKVTLESGTVIRDNLATWKDEDTNSPKNGGGVFVNSGAILTMNAGAVIKNNTSYGSGGGVSLDKGGASLVMLGGEISGNKAGIESGGNTYGGNGGGVRLGENCNFRLEGGTISGNEALQNGGGIFSKGNAYIIGVESAINIKGNTADSSGGAIFASGGTVTINENVTISSNTAERTGGALYVNGSGTVTIEAGTISGNTAEQEGGAIGIASDGSLVLHGGTIKNNTCTDDEYSNGILISGSLSVGENAKIASSDIVRLQGNDTASITIESDLSNSSVATIRPSRYALGLRILSAGSDALLSANYTKFNLVPRDEHSDWFIKEDGTLGCNTGGELQVWVSEDGDDSNSGQSRDDAFKTVARAVTYINDFAENTDLSETQCTILLLGTIYGTATIDTENVGSIQLDGQGEKNSVNGAILNGNASGSVLTIETSKHVGFNNLTITNGSATKGGGIYNKGGDVNLSRYVSISGNNATNGAGIYNESGSVNMNDNTYISGNTASANGGGVYNTDSFSMYGGTVSGNTATENGAGIYNGVSFVMSAGSITGNTATSNGGGVYNAGTMFMYGSAVVGDGSKTATATESAYSNKAASGGGIYSTGTVYLGYSDASTKETLTGGVCYNNSDGVSILNGTLVMDSGSISYNYGRGVYIGSNAYEKYGTFTMSGGSISGNKNSATESGGGVYAGYHGKFTMSGGTISANTAQNGGGLGIANLKSTFTMSGGTISENTATENGGGIYSNMNTDSRYTGSITMSGGTISGNTAATGNGVYINYGPFTMSGSALISSDNDVYLVTGKYITVGGSLSATTPVATITPQAYTQGQKILDGTTALVASEYEKFALTPQGTEAWQIENDGTLTQKVASGISISVPSYTSDDLEITVTEDGSNYKFKAKEGYSSYIWTVNGTVYNTNTSAEVTIQKSGLPLTNVLLLVATDSSGNVHEETVTFTVMD